MREDLKLCCVVMWRLWNNRNAALYLLQPRTSVDLLDWSADFLAEFINTFSACEVDAINVVAAVNYGDVNFLPTGLVVRDIRAFCKDVGVSLCQTIPRARNGLAHSLASLALISSENQLWLDVEPYFFRSCAL
ncbi:hypothetical protein ACOSP7_014988 [Xanthoceras sorbifolium]